MSGTPVRFGDPRCTEYDFLDSILVHCPRCDRIARVLRQPHPDVRPLFAPRRLVCRSCGLARTWAGRGIGLGARQRGPAEDPYLRARLWLQRETRHGRLWAYDLRHLDLIRRCAAAGLRERAPWYDTGQKMTLVARLPAWIKSAKNRDEVLRTVDRLRESVLTEG
ncbi:hypothetical protein SRB17_16210 [Streptomyces sp. RB17]|uniref:hypothetical protein n=1 Tax=Streptomyces sp. RB17 TaxID=2585197 RepID=UPI001296B9E9|nr:hypothetical protein [Streptomyces sp. RB17]MQY33659.1 hypothetical protein [Streptomyces sp. RB17]